MSELDRRCAPRARGAVPRCRSRLARARRAHPDRPRARDGSHRAGGRGGAAAGRQRGSRYCAAGGAPTCRRAGRAHRRREGILGAVLHRHARRAGAAARDRNIGRAGARAASTGRAGARAALRIADLGTGSGAILLALLSELPDAGGIGTDIDAQALAVARRNAEALGLAARARFLRGDYGERAARPVRSRRVEPALRGAPGYRRARAGGARPRSGACARRRRGRACGLSGDRLRCAAPARARRPAGGRDRGRPAARCRAHARPGGACNRRRPARFVGSWRAQLRPLARPHR